VRNDVMYHVVDRGTAEVRPKMFRVIAAITEADDEEFQSAYREVSASARRHDKSEEQSFDAPDIKAMRGSTGNRRNVAKEGLQVCTQFRELGVDSPGRFHI